MSKVITVQDGNLVLTAVATEVDGELQVGDTASADYLSISHDGTKATIATATGMGGIEVNPATGTNFVVLGDASGGRIRAQEDGDPTNYIEMHHSTTTIGWILCTDDIRFDSATDIVGVNSGHEFRMYGGIGTQWGSLQHDGTNLNLTAGVVSGTTDFVMGGSFTGNVKSEKSISILESVSASADSLTYGQLWVRNDNPNTLMYTDGDGGVFAVAGGGVASVLSTGTPADNQVAVWTATSNTLEGDANFTWTGTTLAIAGAGAQLLLPLENDEATPTLAFGDGDSGFYETLDDILSLSLAGTQTWNFASGSFEGNATDAAALLNSGATATVPTVVPVKTDTNTGIGSAAADQLSLITGGIEANRIIASTLQTTTAATTEIESIAVPSDEGFGFEIHIMGTDDTNNDVVFERIFGAIYNATGTTALVGSTITDRTDTAGASGWVITVAADDTGDTLTVDVTGAAVTIDWKCRINLLNV